VDFYRFTLSASDVLGTARVALNPLSLGSGFTLALFNSLTGAALTGRVTTQGSLVIANLAGLPAGDYWLRVTGTRAGRYELVPDFGVAGSTELDFTVNTAPTLDLTALTPGTAYWVEVTSPNLVPTIYSLQLNLPGSTPTETSLATRSDVIRQDVLFGGDDNDILIGGAGEDWIFGGPGNDVLSGGLDLQAEDLLFGNDGDDTFQILPDALPRFLGTLTDRFDGPRWRL
jgi:Ca2+-binding RTX toxin-like protein